MSESNSSIEEESNMKRLLDAPKELQIFCEIHQLPEPIYEIINYEPTGFRKIYKCSVTIDKYNFMGRSISKRLAKCHASLQALTELSSEKNLDTPPNYEDNNQMENESKVN